MGGLTRLEITSFRNIGHCALSPHPHLNVLAGPNASGKTSFLEAIHYLALGRSFRTGNVRPLIRQGDSETVLFVELAGGAAAGLCKHRNGELQLKLNGNPVRGWENIAKELPVQILDTTSFSLLTDGPGSRRRFLDWGVFHVEHQFLSTWRRTRKALKHRNALLKQAGKPDPQQLSTWEAEIVAGSSQITESRDRYAERLQQAFKLALAKLNVSLADEISLHFFSGWNREHDLAALLRDNRENDRSQGNTRHGPHRADLRVKSDSDKAVEVLSRGQQKLVVAALKIAQGELYFETSAQRPIYLIDDLAAELDDHNRVKIFELLQSLGAQLFVTCVALEALASCLPETSRRTVFHVEHGTITA